MTMRVTIKNEDDRRTLRVTPHDIPTWAATAELTVNTKRAASHDILPGASQDFHIYKGRVLVCEEIDQ
jgi:hypothetical protein